MAGWKPRLVGLKVNQDVVLRSVLVMDRIKEVVGEG